MTWCAKFWSITPHRRGLAEYNTNLVLTKGFRCGLLMMVVAFLSSLFLETPLQLLFPSLDMYSPCWTSSADTRNRPSPERLKLISWEKPTRAATVTYLSQRLLISHR